MRLNEGEEQKRLGFSGGVGEEGAFSSRSRSSEAPFQDICHFFPAIIGQRPIQDETASWAENAQISLAVGVVSRQ